MIKIELQSTLQIFHFMINLCHPLVVIKWLLASSFVITAALAYQGRYFPTFRACESFLHTSPIKISDSCPVGYSLEVGDILGWGTGLGSKMSISLREECANKCDALPLCLSFEHSNTKKLCNLNTIAMPIKPNNYGDYAFCRKTGTRSNI